MTYRLPLEAGSTKVTNPVIDALANSPIAPITLKHPAIIHLPLPNTIQYYAQPKTGERNDAGRQ